MNKGPRKTPNPPAGGSSTLTTVRRILWTLAAIGVGAFLYLNLSSAPEGPGNANYADGVGGPFQLTAADGSVVTDQTLRGKPFAIFFGFTRCPDVCPTTLSRLAKYRKQLGAAGDKFAIVFVSVDPEHDKPADIGRYVALFGTTIIGLTGSPDQIDRIVNAYHAYYEKVPAEGGDYTIDHTAAVYLMDRDGKLQSIIDHQESADASLAKLNRLVS